MPEMPSRRLCRQKRAVPAVTVHRPDRRPAPRRGCQCHAQRSGSSPLKNRIEVVIELTCHVISRAISAHGRRVVQFVSAALIEVHHFAIQRDVSKLMAAANLRSCPSRADAPECLRLNSIFCDQLVNAFRWIYWFFSLA